MLSRRNLAAATLAAVLVACGGEGAAPELTAPPDNLAYTANPAVYVVGTAIVPNTPNSSGGAVAFYSVNPLLPAGLSLNTTTGVIGGTPTVAAASASYLVTATNAGGSTSAILNIAVNLPATAPGAPSSVVATADIRSANVAWTSPASDGGSPITGYTVLVSPTTSGANSAINGTTALVTGLANGASYTFTVTASNAVGTGPASPPAAPVTTPDVPGPPTNLAAVAGNQSASLTWTPPWSTGGRSLTGYTVLVSPTSPSAVFDVIGTTAVVTNLTNGSTYTFQVYAATAVGNGPASASSAAVTPTAPPSHLVYATNPAVYRVGTAITPNTPSSGGSAVVSYSVSPSLPAGLSLDGSAGVIGGTPTAVASTADYTVTATNSAGSTTAILSITVNPPPTAPSAPSGVTAMADIRSASVSWVAPASDGGSPITGYTVLIAPPTPAAVIAVVGTTALITGLGNGATCTFTVAASNAIGMGPISPPSDSVTTPNLPGAPTNLGAVPGDQSVSLTWTAPASTGGRPFTGYTVLVSPAAPSAVFNVTGTTATVTNLTNETSYTFRVHATTAVGSGPPSDPSSVVTPVTPPSNLTYATNPAVYLVGSPIAPNTPSSSGGSIGDLLGVSGSSAGAESQRLDWCHLRSPIGYHVDWQLRRDGDKRWWERDGEPQHHRKPSGPAHHHPPARESDCVRRANRDVQGSRLGDGTSHVRMVEERHRHLRSDIPVPHHGPCRPSRERDRVQRGHQRHLWRNCN